MGNALYAIDDRGVIHRFGNSNDVTMYWADSTESDRCLVIPSGIETRLKRMKKDGIAVATCK